jgi:hypothetical protein
MPAHARDDEGAQRRLLPRARAHARDYTTHMRLGIDTPDGRVQYAQRFFIVVPVFCRSALPQAARPLHAARPHEGGHAVDAVLCRAQPIRELRRRRMGADIRVLRPEVRDRFDFARGTSQTT